MRFIKMRFTNYKCDLQKCDLQKCDLQITKAINTKANLKMKINLFNNNNDISCYVKSRYIKLV